MPIVCDTKAVRPSERFDDWQNAVCERYVTASSRNKCTGLLLDGHARSVTEAALRAGFNELSHFSRNFKVAYGISPQLLPRDARRRRA